MPMSSAGSSVPVLCSETAHNLDGSLYRACLATKTFPPTAPCANVRLIGPHHSTSNSPKEKNDQLLPIWLGFSFAGLVYGGLHLLAWNAPFPSSVENKLWRSSGVLLASSGFIYPLSILVFAPFFLGYKCIFRTSVRQVLKKRLGHWYTPLANVVTSVGEGALFSLVVGFACVYLAARGYLVVESFLQLVHLPDSAYALPGWSQYFPHIM
jgi:hypothetical protein